MIANQITAKDYFDPLTLTEVRLTSSRTQRKRNEQEIEYKNYKIWSEREKRQSERDGESKKEGVNANVMCGNNYPNKYQRSYSLY